ncbi:hypothetical protein [Streptomyces capoamus]|uniref:hypothetical protein n=1 Tax=Streptomyces capoamus TaxID=68183 RepID=UPI003399DC1E
MEWEQKAYFETAGGDRAGLLAMNDGHWTVCWAYASPHSGMQMVSYDPERGEEVFKTARDQARTREGLAFDSRTAWQNGSL